MTFADIFLAIVLILALIGFLSVLTAFILLAIVLWRARKFCKTNMVADGEAQRVIDGFVPEDIGA